MCKKYEYFIRNMTKGYEQEFHRNSEQKKKWPGLLITIKEVQFFQNKDFDFKISSIFLILIPSADQRMEKQMHRNTQSIITILEGNMAINIKCSTKCMPLTYKFHF